MLYEYTYLLSHKYVHYYTYSTDTINIQWFRSIQTTVSVCRISPEVCLLLQPSVNHNHCIV